jgi:C4-dicarboxylate-specific signal transduction histidine kinase
MMHNIRNTLAPVSTAIWKGRASLKDVKTENLAQAGQALATGEVDADRKAKLAEYVNASAKHISERCQNADAAFETIHGFANHIELVLKHHEDLSRGVRHVEPVALSEVVALSAKLVHRSHGAPIEVEIGDTIERLAPVTAQRIVLAQVLENLVVNAMQSIERAKTERGRISFDARDVGGQIELSIRDNGEGIPAERMSSLFQRGFTSREKEGRGLGLHYCATSLGAMGGSIKVESDGLGKGAVFRVILPVAVQKEKAA